MLTWENIGTGSLASAYSTYVELGCVAISTNITVDAKDKKVFDKTPWKTAASSFDETKNSLMVVCGRSNLCCIDVDNVKGTAAGMEAWAYFEKEAGGPFDTFTVKTGNDGKHIFFTQEGIVAAPWNGSYARCFKIDGEAVEIDVRGVGGMVYAAPSSYTDGAGNMRCYTVINGSAPMKMPTALVELLTKHTDNAATKAAPREMAPSAGRAAGALSTAAAAALEIGRGGAGAAAGTSREPTIEEVFRAITFIGYICDHAGEETAVDTAVWANHSVFIRLAYAACNLSQGSMSSVGLYKPLMRLNAKYTKLRGGEREDADALWRSTDRNRADCPGLPYIEHVYKEYLRKLLPLQQQGEPSGTEPAVGGAGGSVGGSGGSGWPQGGASVTVYTPLKRLICDVHTQLGLNVSDAGVHKLMSSVKAYTVYDFGHYVCDVLSSKYRYVNDSSQSAQGAGAYFFDGTRYVFKSLAANLNCYAQSSMVSVLQTMLDLTDPSCPGYASRTPISDDERGSISAILSKVKGGAKGYETIWSQVSKLIQSDQFYGQPVESTFNQKIIWVGNFPPKVNGALLKRMMPFEFTAKFGDHDDDPVRGLWRAADSTVMMEKYKRWAPYHMMLLNRYSWTMKELPKPEGGIMDRMLENTPARTVADFLTGYRHTNDDDKATITSKNTIGISQLRDEYKNQCGLNIDQNAFMDELERLGVKVKRTATRSNGVNHNKLAWLQCIPDTEAPARTWGAALADSADEAP
jgi:hypothetical protein